jgi:Tol biopolymer transport system component
MHTPVVKSNRQISPKPFFFCVASLLLYGILVSSCGGKHQTPTSSAPNASRTASISLSIRWPEKPTESTRLIPLAAQSIKIELRDANNNLIDSAPKVVARPAMGNTSNVLFSGLSPQNITFKATAFPNTDGTGVAQSAGTILVTVVSDQTVPALITMDSTIVSVKIIGNSGTALSVGQTRKLTAQALNSARETVLVAPSQWEWTSSDTTNFTLTPSGESASLKANSVGSTTISLKDKESGKIISISVSSDLPNLSNTKIAFVSNRDGNDEIYLMNSDGTNQTRLTNNIGYDFNPTFSQDNKKIIFWTNRDGNDEIYSMNIDGTELTNLTKNSGNDRFFRLSINNKTFCFVSNRHNAGNYEIYSINIDGTELKRLTNSIAGNNSPQFSPDGSKIVFGREPVGLGFYEICIMNADGSNLKSLIASKEQLYIPSFSPDGKKIVFTKGTYQYSEIYTMNIDGTEQLQLTNNTSRDINPAFSPDGIKIFFGTDRESNYPLLIRNNDFYSMNVDGSEQKKIAKSSESSPSDFNFSPDGQKIIFTSYQDDNNNICSINMDGTEKKKLINQYYGNFQPSWSGFIQ